MVGEPRSVNQKTWCCASTGQLACAPHMMYRARERVSEAPRPCLDQGSCCRPPRSWLRRNPGRRPGSPCAPGSPRSYCPRWCGLPSTFWMHLWQNARGRGWMTHCYLSRAGPMRPSARRTDGNPAAASASRPGGAGGGLGGMNVHSAVSAHDGHPPRRPHHSERVSGTRWSSTGAAAVGNA